MTISGLEMAQKRKCEIPPKDDDGIQILYEKYDDMEVWYSSTKKKKELSNSPNTNKCLSDSEFCDSFLKSNLFGCAKCLAKQLLLNIENMKW